MGNLYPQTGYLRLLDDVQQKFLMCGFLLAIGRQVMRLSDSREKVYAGGVPVFLREDMRLKNKGCLFFFSNWDFSILSKSVHYYWSRGYNRKVYTGALDTSPGTL